MKDQEKQIMGRAKSYVHGFISLFSYSNLYQGRDSLGDRLIDSTNNSRISNKPYAFMAGFFTKLAVPIYMASTSESVRWHHVIAADIAIKTIPRGIERIVKHWKRVDEEII